MDESEIVARADANYFESWRTLARANDGAEIREGAGLLVINSGIPLAWFNIAFITRPLVSPAAALRRGIEYYDAHRMPFVVRVREGVDPEAERALESLGLTYGDAVPGMVLRAPAPPGDAPGLEVRTVHDERGLAEHVEVIAAAFGMPLDMARTLLGPRVVGVPDFELYVGYADGAPVSTAALMLSHGVAGVYNVATLAAHRGHGYGEALTWHAVRRGMEQGAAFASLQASEMGAPIYARMGFETVAPYRTFARPRSGEH